MVCVAIGWVWVTQLYRSRILPLANSMERKDNVENKGNEVAHGRLEAR